MTYQTIEFSIEERIARITFNRPESANGMNLQFMEEFAHAVHACEEQSVRAVVITGNGRFFSAGGDVAAFASDLDKLPRVLKDLTANLHVAISRLVRMDAPVIAAVNGPCAGAGMSLACACDFVMAAESATFTAAYTGIGLTPDGGCSWFLPRRIGELRTRELLLTNRRLRADEAKEWGLVSQVVPDAELLIAANELARRMAAGPTLAFGKVKALLNDTFSHGMETQMELESRYISASALTRDARVNIEAFLKKQPTHFIGE